MISLRRIPSEKRSEGRDPGPGGWRMTERLARASSRRPWLVIGPWLVAILDGTRPIEAKVACLQALRETGATGLEPATSGVTGRSDSHGAWRRSTTSSDSHSGCD